MEIKQGDILSEIQYYNVLDATGSGVKVNFDGTDKEVSLSEYYLKTAKMYSADYFEITEKVTATRMAEIFLEKSRLPMTIEFYTKRKESDAKKWAEDITHNNILNVKEITKQLKEFLRGDLRMMVGRHYGVWTPNNTRISFIDMKLERDMSKDYDTRTRQVDPRTLQSMIVDSVKYVLK